MKTITIMLMTILTSTAAISQSDLQSSGKSDEGTLVKNSVNESVQVVELFQSSGPFSNSIMIEWKTLSELKNEGFVIERKKSAEEEFEFAGYVDGNGTTNIKNKYTFIEMKPSKEVEYRVKQISYNGEYKYFYPVPAVAER